MSELLEALAEIDTPVIIAFMLVGLGIAFFHTIIFQDFFNLNFSKWLFFIIDPLLIGVSFFIYKPLGGIVFFFLFFSIFLLFTVGMLYSAIRDHRKGKNKTPWWKIVLGLFAGLIFFVAFFLFGPYMFLFIVAFIILSKILPNPQNRFLKLQSILPTSNIRSMAMGLVEVKGIIKTIDSLNAPIDSTKCVGYRYTVENISKDRDNRPSYSTRKDVTICNDFYIVDNTGEVRVKGKDLEFLWVDMADRYSSSNSRYTQYLLKEGDEMLLIGKASTENQETIIEKEDVRKVFMIAPAFSIDKWNTYKPLLRSFLIMTIMIAIIAVWILFANISVEGNSVYFKLDSLRFDWEGLFNYF